MYSSRDPRAFSLFVCAVLLALFSCLHANADTYHFENVERIVAIGDVHGAHDELVSILRGTELIDEELNWTGGAAHLVSVGDLLDRGDHGRQVLDLLMRLENEAAAAGGAVHVLLGNHEVMVLTGDLRYVSEGDFAQYGSESHGGMPPGFMEYRAAFAPAGEYGRWLLGKPVMIRIDDSLFVHGGLSGMLADKSLATINASAMHDVRRFAEGRHALLDAGLLSDTDDFDAIRARARTLADGSSEEEYRDLARGMLEALNGLPFHPDGPLWYRGSSLCHPYTETMIASGVLKQLGAKRAAFGHTPTHNRRITSRMDGRVYRIDTGINNEAYQGRPSALVIEGDRVSAWYKDDGSASIEAEPNRVWARPHGMSDAELEDFLLTAEITKSEDIGIGVTESTRLTLEKDGRRIRASFKTIDTDPGLENSRVWPRTADFADRYQYEIAAYRLDRILDLHMVPVTVERVIGRERGAVQYWIENSFNEVQRREQNIPFTGHCDLKPQYDVMNVFDILIFNVDRNLGDILYDSDWTLWLVDHSRSFGTQRGVPAMVGRAQINVTPELYAVLEGVTQDRLKELETWLNRRQIQALVTRAQWLRRRL